MKLDDIKNSRWEDIGLLAGVPEERKEYVYEKLDMTLEYVNNLWVSTTGPIIRTSDGKTISEEQKNEIQMILFPIVTRITTKVDMELSDLKNIYATLLFGIIDYIEENKELVRMGIDLEAMYTTKLCESFIENRKKK